MSSHSGITLSDVLCQMTRSAVGEPLCFVRYYFCHGACFSFHTRICYFRQSLSMPAPPHFRDLAKMRWRLHRLRLYRQHCDECVGICGNDVDTDGRENSGGYISISSPIFPRCLQTCSDAPVLRREDADPRGANPQIPQFSMAPASCMIPPEHACRAAKANI